MGKDNYGEYRLAIYEALKLWGLDVMADKALQKALKQLLQNYVHSYLFDLRKERENLAFELKKSQKRVLDLERKIQRLQKYEKRESV